jgi:hypothetical protein
MSDCANCVGTLTVTAKSELCEMPAPQFHPVAFEPKRNWFRYWWVILAALPIVLIVAGVRWIESWPPNSLETRVAFFRRHQTEFGAYVERIRDGKVASGASGYALPQFMIDNDVKQANQENGCVVITFWFMPTDAVPNLIYAPHGVKEVPDDYKSGGPEGAKWAYWKFLPIDDKWFYCEWDN